MSRELLVGLLFAALAGADLIRPSVAARAGALGAALALALAQGFLVRGARAIPAWDVAVLPLLFLVSALLSGAGLLLVVEALGGAGASVTLLGGALGLVIPALVVWLGYLAWSREPAFVGATRCLRAGPHAAAIVVVGYAIPFACLALVVGLPGLAAPLAAVAGALLVAGQAWAKAALLLRAGELRAITLEGLTLRRRAS
jgi:formate-dependent nitrite reductase membrane component NrfD